MLNKLKAFIAKNELINDGEKLLLAVSGGKDSVLMAHLFAQLNYDFSIAHCNFKLRAQDSYLDEQFVKELGQKLKVPEYKPLLKTSTFSINCIALIFGAPVILPIGKACRIASTQCILSSNSETMVEII